MMRSVLDPISADYAERALAWMGFRFYHAFSAYHGMRRRPWDTAAWEHIAEGIC